ncbi:hypothetical protein [Pseudoduganella lutea]|uniref:Uncharacterized protein n=1 Tax=Pseudoduganella lutea TaxID=321985 RepID=A0A4P6L534_9BURK|nr:hypothetical protein [Pseudoduganella lutea]QBE66741.1 hypothetical protein EWM63_30350 [Pseudoduganella lutea]
MTITPPPSPDISAERWVFEKEVRLHELTLRERELLLKETELELKRKEMAASSWRSPLIVAILAGSIAAVGNAWVAFSNANSLRDLETQKAEQARLLEMIKTGDPDKAAVNLGFLIDAGLVADSGIKARVASYLKTRKPGTGAALEPTVPGSKLAPPIVENGRIYLLAGEKEKSIEFPRLKEELKSAGFGLVGARVKEDAGRPDHPEVRYFNASDKAQSEKIAEFMRFYLNTDNVVSKQYVDPTGKPGYIEIWLGR